MAAWVCDLNVVIWDVVSVDKPDDVNVVIGQAHFIKAVEDRHGRRTIAAGSARLCEASGSRLVRHTGNDGDLVELDPHCAGHRGRA